MIWFIIKGLIRDRSRSLFPVLTVTFGVSLVVLAQAYMGGAMGDMIDLNAKFETGHVKVATRAYHNNTGISGNDLALTDIAMLMDHLRETYPDYQWQPRIKFGGLLDLPDENGETIDQAMVVGLGVRLLGSDTSEVTNLKLQDSLRNGRLPSDSGEVLISDQVFQRLKMSLGQTVTLVSQTMDLGAAVENFVVVGTVAFGVATLDRGAIVADFEDIQFALAMDDAATEILGLRHQGYSELATESTKRTFNQLPVEGDERFAPQMISIRDQAGFAQYLDLSKNMSAVLIAVYLLIVTLVLWNAGIRGGIRRYSEFGLRLAIGEDARRVYASQILESVIVGVSGSVLGTLLGLIPALYLQEVGLDITGMMDGQTSAILFQNVLHARITSVTLWIGFIPGIVANLIGAAMAGTGIFRRSTAELFKELET